MKILAILGVVIVLSLLSTALISGCQQQASPTPQARPTLSTPPPSPTLEPATPPTPPAPAPEAPHYEITLVSFDGVLTGASTGLTQLFFSGEVRNDSPVSLKAVDVVITSYRENNDIVAIDKWSTFPWVIQPGETSKFSLRVDDYVNAVRYEVSFEHLEPGILELSVAPGVSREFFVPH